MEGAEGQEVGREVGGAEGAEERVDDAPEPPEDPPPALNLLLERADEVVGAEGGVSPVLRDDLSALGDARAKRAAREEAGERLGQKHSASAAAVQGGGRVEYFPLRLREGLAQRVDQLDVEAALEAVAAVREVLHLRGLEQVGQSGKEKIVFIVVICRYCCPFL